MSDQRPMPIVFINGWPGSGKRTIAEELRKLFPDLIRVVDTHAHDDYASSLLPTSSPSYYYLRKQLRAQAFQTLWSCPYTHDMLCVFTDFQPNDERGTAIAGEYQAAAAARGFKFIPIVLTCTAGWNESCLITAHRAHEAEFSGSVLTNAAMLHLRRQDMELHRFGGADKLRLDVSMTAAADVAISIARHIKKVMGRMDEPVESQAAGDVPITEGTN